MKRIILLFMLTSAVVTSVFIASDFSAQAHTNPSNGLPCTNSHYRLSETSLNQSWPEYHNSGTGLCTKTFRIYAHQKYCSSCNANLGAGPTFKCTEDHSICDIHNKDCQELY